MLYLYFYKHKRNAISLSPSDTGRGLQTKSTIRAGEIIISLPKKLLITNETAFQSDIGPYLKK